jgi:diguanylate cyclase (GGDEF)-like protein
LRINLAKKAVLERVLQRKKLNSFQSPSEVDLKEMLRDILKWANEFVPSESGSIFLDDPILINNLEKSGTLYFVACFGVGSRTLTGTSLPIDVGIVGKTYKTGRAYMTGNPKKDSNFYGKIDKYTKYRSKSIIAVPVKIKGTTIGVLELINKLGTKENYTKKDLTLLKIFAGYTSTLIQNSLDAKKFGELSIRDSLTGLFNDRYFYERLTKESQLARRRKKDLSLIFLDLDNFKQVNDTHGHLVGSRLLSEVGNIIMDISKLNNAIPVRYGGDEFSIILPDKGIIKAGRFAEDIRAAIEKCVFLSDAVCGKGKGINIKGLITASIGAASLNANIRPNAALKDIREGLIRASDEAMYTAKDAGKNVVKVAPKLATRKTKGKSKTSKSKSSKTL